MEEVPREAPRVMTDAVLARLDQNKEIYIYIYIYIFIYI